VHVFTFAFYPRDAMLARVIVIAIDVINVIKIIINVNKRVYSKKIVNVCKLKVNVHRA